MSGSPEKSATESQPNATLPVLAADAPVLQLLAVPISTPPPTPVAAKTCGDIVKPAAISPIPIALRRNLLIDDALEVVLMVAFALTLDLEDLPRAFAYSPTAVKQFKASFHITL